MSDRGKVVKTGYRGELFDYQTCSTDEASVDIRFAHDGHHVAGLDRTTVEDADLVGGASLVVEEFAAIARFYDLPDL